MVNSNSQKITEINQTIRPVIKKSIYSHCQLMLDQSRETTEEQLEKNIYRKTREWKHKQHKRRLIVFRA